jgi:hypothetical protein
MMLSVPARQLGMKSNVGTGSATVAVNCSPRSSPEKEIIVILLLQSAVSSVVK